MYRTDLFFLNVCAVIEAGEVVSMWRRAITSLEGVSTVPYYAVNGVTMIWCVPASLGASNNMGLKCLADCPQITCVASRAVSPTAAYKKGVPKRPCRPAPAEFVLQEVLGVECGSQLVPKAVVVLSQVRHAACRAGSPP